MGCDVHAWVERKNHDGDWQWVKLYRKTEFRDSLEVVDVYPGRCYDLFSILAGVRGQYDSLKRPIGLPQDLSEDLKEEWDCWEEDAHNTTFYDIFELAYWVEKLKSFGKEREEEYELLRDFYEGVISYIEFAEGWYHATGVNQYRVIMWFDS